MCCRVVNHEQINKADYCTISRKGVARMRSDDETEFVTLDRWEQEYDYFQKLIQVDVHTDQHFFFYYFRTEFFDWCFYLHIHHYMYTNVFWARILTKFFKYFFNTFIFYLFLTHLFFTFFWTRILTYVFFAFIFYWIFLFRFQPLPDSENGKPLVFGERMSEQRKYCHIPNH